MRNRRSRRSRLRGRRTCGYGHKFKHRGKGSKGGKGKAGTGKMAGQKKTFVLRYFPNYLGKHGFKSKNKKLRTINLSQIQEKLDTFLKDGIAKKTGSGIEITLKNYKVLSSGNIRSGLIIKAKEFSKKTEEKILASGNKAEKTK